ncbi:MAG: aminopeptidase P family protein [Cyclobacteriaceae bacterium]
MFSQKTYTDRRTVLKSSVGKGVILLTGNEESCINFSDNWYPFRQDSTFLYYFGLPQPGLAAILDCESGEEILFGDDLSIDEIVWTGDQPTILELAKSVGVAESRPMSALEKLIGSTMDAGRKLHMLPPYRSAQKILLAELTGWPANTLTDQASLPLINAIARQRNIKTTEEIDEIERAVAITTKMHLEAMKFVKAGMKEHEVAGKVYETAIGMGGQLAFPLILTRDGQTLHNHSHHNVLKEGDMVLCDTGAETSKGYCGDMTRTFPVSDRFTSQQAAIYEIVLQAHTRAVDALKPGMAFREIHLLACAELFEGLKSLGLTKGDTHEAVAAGAHAMFFQCGLGHLMGLDVHDMENLGEENVGYTKQITKSQQFGLKSLRLGRELEEGFILTVEPGIYIIPQLIDLWQSEKRHEDFINYRELEKFRGFGGIRIEEDFLITSSGSRLLGPPVPKSVDEIETIRANVTG